MIQVALFICEAKNQLAEFKLQMQHLGYPFYVLGIGKDLFNCLVTVSADILKMRKALHL